MPPTVILPDVIPQLPNCESAEIGTELFPKLVAGIFPLRLTASKFVMLKPSPYS